MNRTDKWREPYYLPRIISGDVSPELQKLLDARPLKENKGGPLPSGLSLLLIILDSKEIIFDIEDGKMKLIFVMFSLDHETLQICVSNMFETAGPLSDDSVKSTLAVAHVYEIPVLPNNDNCEDKLLQLYSDLYERGFEIDNGSEKTKLMLTEKSGAPAFGLNDDRFLSSIDFTRIGPPALAMAARRMAEQREIEFRKAKRFLDEVEAAIACLTNTLDDPNHRESDLQKCLQDNPILFGTEYREVIPKLALGAEFEMDFALKTWNGEIHILEIEDSRKMLFTKKLRPSADLVHAEQQVLDWYDWIERFPNYAGNKLADLDRPYGFIIVGRAKSSERDALIKRNRTFKGRFQTLTYDDLLAKASHLRVKVAGR